jgi:1,4-dihydroxy-6-naphthoate synthase
MSTQYSALGTQHSALSLAVSPCPNDTFIFDAWINGKLEEAPAVRSVLEDVSSLNERAFRGERDVIKVSFYAYGLVRNAYTLINAGGALGRGCGPLIVVQSRHMTPSMLAEPGLRIAVPGPWTTANLLVSLYQPEIKKRVYLPFEQIMPAVARGDVDAGVIIHEGRFTYAQYGLIMMEDLGAWWERTTQLPVPLGAIIAKKSLGPEHLERIESTIRRSLRHALANPDAPLAFMQQHATEMDTDVMRKHVELYVNNYSLDYGPDGRQAIEHLILRAEEKGLLNNSSVSRTV